MEVKKVLIPLMLVISIMALPTVFAGKVDLTANAINTVKTTIDKNKVENVKSNSIKASPVNPVTAGLSKPVTKEERARLQEKGYDMNGPRQGGDTCAEALAITSLPYADTGTTTGYVNDYDEVCPYTGSTAPDVVYVYTPAAEVIVDITLCVGDTDYDTKLYVYENTCPDPGNYFACSDDACSAPYYSSYVSEVTGVTLTGGNSYYIVVDGFGTNSGTYTLEVTEGQAWDPPMPCPLDSLYSQPVDGPDDAWSFATSDVSPGYVVYDNFSGVESPICDIHWWGMNLAYDAGWTTCYKDPQVYDVTFYADDGGVPGAVVCETTVTPLVEDTGYLYADVYPLYYFSAGIHPCCQLSAGWVSIEGAGDSTCWLLWGSSPIGDGDSLQWDGTVLDSTLRDRSFCLTPEWVDPTGACCDDSTGTCNDLVDMSACQPPLRFAMDTLCSELEPACGLGACCDPNTGNCYPDTTETWCFTTYGAGNWHPGVTCDPNPCPCIVNCPIGGIQEGEPCGDDTNGGCNASPPVFTSLQCGNLYCGKSYASEGTRDTDWYEVVVTEPTSFTWTAEAELPVVIGMIETDPPGSGDCADSTGYLNPYTLGEPCEEIFVEVDVMPGTYWFFVAPSVYDGYACADGPWDYKASLTCETITDGACCNPSTGECSVTDIATCDGLYGPGNWLPGEVCDPNPCPQPPPPNDDCDGAIDVGTLPASVSGDNTWATDDIAEPCGVYSGPYKNVWYTVTGTGNTITVTTCNDVSEFDSKISVFCYSCDYLICVGGNDDDCVDYDSLLSTYSFCSDLGETYYITVGGFSSSSYGVFQLDVSDDATACQDPPNCEPALGACCVDQVCTATNFEFECDALDGMWFEGETCPEFQCPDPSGNDCATPIMVNIPADLDYMDTNFTCGRLNDYEETCLGSYDGGEDIIYMLNVTADTYLQFSLDPLGTTWTGFAVDDSCPPDTECIINENNSYLSDPYSSDCMNFTAGTYYLMIDTYPSPDCIPEFDLTIAECIPCVVPCPMGGLDEGEACGEDTNGGCNSTPPVFTSIQCGDIYCGNAWAEDSTRDTDWYELVLTEPYTVTMTAEAEFDVIIGYVPTDPPGAGDCAYLLGSLDPYATGEPCEEISVEVDLGAGTHWFFIAPTVFEGYPCALGPWEYAFSLECTAPPTGACCVDSVCVETNTQPECDAMNGWWFEGETCPEYTCPFMGGDDCTDPFPVTIPAEMPFANQNTTCGRVNDYSETCLGSYDGGEDIIYQITVTEDVSACLSLITDASWIGMAIDDECPPADPCLDYNTSTGSNVGFDYSFTAGTYYVMIDTWPSPDCINDFIFSIDELPANDDCANATAINEVVDMPFNTMCATADGPGDYITSPNVWYCYTPTCSGDSVLATVSLLGSMYDTKLAVYEGCTCDPVGEIIASNDDFGGELQSQVTFVADVGQTYLIEVGGYSSSTGMGILNVSCEGVSIPATTPLGIIMLLGGLGFVLRRSYRKNR